MGRRSDGKRRDRRKERSAERRELMERRFRGEVPWPGVAASAHWWESGGPTFRVRGADWSFRFDFSHGITVPFDPHAPDAVEKASALVKEVVARVNEQLVEQRDLPRGEKS